jgi:peptidoglycan/xylan/chitin deacetylase (PgdA/CDA1 family)
MVPMTVRDSQSIAWELLREINAPNGIEFIDYPKKGIRKNEVLIFCENKLTDIILKREQTTQFGVSAIFSDVKLKGDPICINPDGTPVITIENEIIQFAFDPFELHFFNITEGYQTWKSSRMRNLALSMYWHVPDSIRKRVRSVARRRKTSNIRSLDDVDLLGVSSNVIVHLLEKHMNEIGVLKKKNQQPTAVITHDVDTDFCQKTGREVISSIEQEEGVSSTWFVVPNSIQYSLNIQGITNLFEMGHEIGMHGLRHDGKLQLNDTDILVKQLVKGKKILEALGIQVTSFRSPWALRSQCLLSCLVRSGFNADSSYPDKDTLGMTGKLKGIEYNRPFRPFGVDINSEHALPIWEIPMTNPQDVQLVEDLNATEKNLLKVWKYKADFCSDYGGVFTLHTHPIHLMKRLDSYKSIIRWLQEQDFEILTMNKLVDYMESSLGAD